MKRILPVIFAVILLLGTCYASESVSYGTLLADLVEAYESPSEEDLARIDADVAALDDEIADAIAENWKRIYLDPDYELLLYGKDDPAMLDIPNPVTHAFVILGYELQNGEMTDELKGRCSAAAAAAYAFPEAILVCSGGATGKNNPENHTEAGLMRDYLVNICGIDDARIFTDERALNTAENAMNTFEILRMQETETMTIITSSYHQRRAQVLYNALAALYRQEFGYSALIVGNYSYDIEPSGINASAMDDRLAVQQLAGILSLPQEQRNLLPSLFDGSGEASGDTASGSNEQQNGTGIATGEIGEGKNDEHTRSEKSSSSRTGGRLADWAGCPGQHGKGTAAAVKEKLI